MMKGLTELLKCLGIDKTHYSYFSNMDYHTLVRLKKHTLLNIMHVSWRVTCKFIETLTLLKAQEFLLKLLENEKGHTISVDEYLTILEHLVPNRTVLMLEFTSTLIINILKRIKSMLTLKPDKTPEQQYIFYRLCRRVQENCCVGLKHAEELRELRLEIQDPNGQKFKSTQINEEEAQNVNGLNYQDYVSHEGELALDDTPTYLLDLLTSLKSTISLSENYNEHKSTFNDLCAEAQINCSFKWVQFIKLRSLPFEIFPVQGAKE